MPKHCYSACMQTTEAIPPAPYDGLGPDTILDALEHVGLAPNGSLHAMNSYENRVYQAGLEDGSFVVVKFYRPGRWTRAAVEEEHAFTQALFDDEISVVPPMHLQGSSVLTYLHYLFAVFPRQGGHPPNLENEQDLEVLARTIARIHAAGSRQPFQQRNALSAAGLGKASRDFLLENDFIPPEVVTAYETLSEDLLQRITPLLDDLQHIRIHGDCHMGNVLWRHDTPHFVDFDDCVMGPPIQDLWMLLSGERQEQTIQLATILDAYQDFYDFDTRTLPLIEPLRTLRIMHHSAWIARRWHDPAFPVAFPTFNTVNYWSNHILALREQMAMLDELPLTYL